MRHKIGDMYETKSHIIKITNINGTLFNYAFQIKSDIEQGKTDKSEWRDGSWANIARWLEDEWVLYKISPQTMLPDSLFEVE